MYTADRSAKMVGNWLLFGVAMTVIQFALGGITRLTGSGLSITQWDVITGALPPLNEAQWMAEFEKYKQTPQFHLLNFDFQLSDFKFIFFWEWFHRLWGRLIGLVFAAGFIWFFFRKHFKKEMITPFAILFLLGALQGAIGWIMVASGLSGDSIYVKPTRLALHFIFAMGLLCYTFWFALHLRVPAEQRMQHKPLHRLTGYLLIILVIQLLYGALMAGHKAANVAPTWPTINGQWIPDHLIKGDAFWLNFIDNTLLVHFMHRGLAYLLLIVIARWSYRMFMIKGTDFFEKVKWIPLLLVIVQVILGISTLLTSTGISAGHWGCFEWIAQFHQLTGMALLLSVVMMRFVTSKEIPAT